MSGISYETKVTVKLDGKIIGHIQEKNGGFAYFPKGSKDHGEIFSSISDVKKSLEEDDD